MAELLDPEGAWSLDLVELMMPVAMELEAQDARRTFEATASAVHSLFDRRAAREFTGRVKDAIERARGAARVSRGEEAPQGETTADAMMKIARKLGLEEESSARQLRAAKKKRTV